jgi:hypothetical protein
MFNLSRSTGLCVLLRLQRVSTIFARAGLRFDWGLGDER